MSIPEPDEWDWEEDTSATKTAEVDLDDPPDTCSVSDARVAYFTRQLWSYLEDLADPCVRDDVHQELSRQSFKDMEHYYWNREDLADYTINTEVHRMKYIVTTEGGGVLTDTEGVKGALADQRPHLLVCLANQSIFASMLQALHKKFLRPDLDIAITSKESTFCLDFRSNSMEAKSTFLLYALGQDCASLNLATIEGMISVQVAERVFRQQFKTPSMKMVFDDHVAQAALLLARHEAMGADLNRKRPVWEGAVANLGVAASAGADLLRGILGAGAPASDCASEPDDGSNDHSQSEDDWEWGAGTASTVPSGPQNLGGVPHRGAGGPASGDADLSQSGSQAPPRSSGLGSLAATTFSTGTFVLKGMVGGISGMLQGIVEETQSNPGRLQLYRSDNESSDSLQLKASREWLSPTSSQAFDHPHRKPAQLRLYRTGSDSSEHAT